MNNEQLRAELQRTIHDSPKGEYAELLNRCYVALGEQQSVPDGLPLVLAGVLFDFAGFLTTRPQVIEVGATANASPMADLVKEFAAIRGLSLDDAAVLSWQELIIAGPSAPAAPEVG